MAQSRSTALHPFLIALAGLLLLAAAAIVFSLWAFRADGEHKVQEELGALEQHGFFITERELLAAYRDVPWPSEENAAQLLANAFPLMHTSREAWASLPDLSEWNGVDERPQVRDLLERNAEALKLFHQASSRPFLRFPLDIASGARPDHVEPLREGGRLLRLEALAHAYEGSFDGAVESIETLHRLSVLLGEEPKLWSQMVVLALRNLAAAALEKILEKGPLPDEKLLELDQMLAELEDQPVVETALQGEIIAASRQIREFFDRERLLSALHAGTGLHLQDEAFFLEQVQVLLAARGDPDRLEALKQSYETFSLNPLSEHGRFAATSLLSMALHLTRSHLANVTYNRIQRILLSADRFRADHGRLPDELAALVPGYLAEPLQDPYAGDAFRMVVKDGWFVVESAGTVGRPGNQRRISLRIPLERER